MGPISTSVHTSVENSSAVAHFIEQGLNYIPGGKGVVDSVINAFYNVKREEIVGIAFLAVSAMTVLSLSAFVISKLVKCCRGDKSRVDGKAVIDSIKELKKENARLLKENADLSSRVKVLEREEAQIEVRDGGPSRDAEEVVAEVADNVQVAAEEVDSAQVAAEKAIAAKKVEFEVLKKEIETIPLIPVKYEAFEGEIIAEIPDDALTDKGGKKNANPPAYDSCGLPIMKPGADNKDHPQHILLNVVNEFNNKKEQLETLRSELTELEAHLVQIQP